MSRGGANADEASLRISKTPGPGQQIGERHWPLHPFFFAAASVLAVLAGRTNYASLSDSYPELAAALSFALLTYLLVALLRRRFDRLAAVIASIWIVGALFFVDLFRWLNTMLDGGFAMLPTLPVAIVILLVLTVLAVKAVRLAPLANIVMNAISVVMVATALWQIGLYNWNNADAYGLYDGDRAAAMEGLAPTETNTGDGPDIYHLLFDRYASEPVLSEYYDTDNAEIGRFLEDQGFRVARASNSNYLKTGPSLASTFYMDYLGFLAEDPPRDANNWHPIFEMLDDHRVGRFLKARGYEFVQFGSWWAGTYKNAVADENRPHGFSEFGMIYWRGTALRPIFHALPDTPLTMRLDWDNAQCQRVADQVEEIKALGKRERDRPLYVFAHFLLPHGPFVFTEDGECLTGGEAAERGDDQGYLDQIAYANAIIRDVVSSLQTEGGEPPVILIQADEGPFPERDGSIPWQEATADELRIKTGILNAYYFPNGDYGAITDDITPVNSYRILFNSYFDAGFPLLEDRIVAFPHDWELYEYHDVTERVRGGDESEADSLVTAPGIINRR